ncbi:MAG: cell filamentation protein Fic [Advenella sp.]|nr:cell filamentation protein Fic [Advenella sp.]
MTEIVQNNSALFQALGFTWDRLAVPDNVPVHDIKRACFRLQKMLAQYVFDASVLEGNPFTYPQVQTVLDGITVGGHRLSDQDQVLNLAESTKKLLQLVKTGSFRLDKETFTMLHAIVAKEEAFEWGHFRGEGDEKNYTPHVGLGIVENYIPPATQPGAPNLNRIFSEGLGQLETLTNPLEKGLAFFLFGALQQFFFDGNKRTSRMMMNGVLMSNGIDAISIPATRAQEFNEKMVDFYVNRDATVMMAFMVDCHPDAGLMQMGNKK